MKYNFSKLTAYVPFAFLSEKLCKDWSRAESMRNLMITTVGAPIVGSIALTLIVKYQTINPISIYNIQQHRKSVAKELKLNRKEIESIKNNLNNSNLFYYTLENFDKDSSSSISKQEYQTAKQSLEKELNTLKEVNDSLAKEYWER